MLMPTTPASSVADAFAAGDYTHVVGLGRADDWRTFAAMGLIGKTREAIAGLSRFVGEEPRFYQAVAHWMAAEEAEAIALLETCPSPHPQALLRLIRKPVIEVLTQLPWYRSGPQDLISGAKADAKFALRNIGDHPDDVKPRLYGSVHDYVDPAHPPDFYLSMMVEWHLTPPDLQTLGCPTFGHTSDYDIHIHATHPWMAVFDELVVTDHTEWLDVSKLVDGPVSTFPKAFGISTDLPMPTAREREVDFFMSGTLLSTYHPDKARLLAPLYEMPGTKYMLNGWMSNDNYHTMLKNAKATFTYYRRPGGTVTRGLEALNLGCAIVVQAPSVLCHYFDESDGVLTYDDADPASLAAALRRVSEEWSTFCHGAIRGAAKVREEFSIEKAASQYLRYLTFRAAMPRPERAKVATEHLIQKRPVVSGAWVALSSSADCINWALDNFERETKRMTLTHDKTAAINRTRELLMLVAASAANVKAMGISEGFKAVLRDEVIATPAVQEAITLMRVTFEEDMARFPMSLALVFNYVRTMLYFGQDEHVIAALKMAANVLSLPMDSWQVDPMDDVLTWELFPSTFNYRTYFDTVTEQLKTRHADSKPLVALIYASLAFMLGLYLKEPEYYEHAIALDPEFPVYRFELAKLLVGSPNPAEVEAGAEALLALRHSALVVMVQEVMENLLLSNRLPADAAVTADMRRAVLGMRANKGSLIDHKPIGYGID